MTRAREQFRPVLAMTLLISSALPACSVNPVTGERELVLMSTEQEKALGAQAAAQVEQEIGLVDDPELTAYVRAIGERLAADSPRQDVDYQFFVADMEEPNAFALPGGYIYVSRGLLALSNSEDELANVIGHEIGHVAARHSAQRQTRATGIGILTVLGTVLAGSKGGADAAQQAQQLGQVIGAGLIATYSREQERQSDEIGQDLAAENGWNPLGMADFMAQLGSYTVLKTGARREASWFDSHPTSDERVQNATERAAQLTVTPEPAIAGTRGEYYTQLDGLLVGPDPAGGVFRDQLFLHPGLNFAVRFPAGWDTANQRSAVLAAPRSREATIDLMGQGDGAGDPRAAAREFTSQNKLNLTRSRSVRINGFDAFQGVAEAQAEQGMLAVHLTWIAHPQMMVRITAMTPSKLFNKYVRDFDAAADSFRALEASEETSFTELHLDVVAARGAEFLPALSQRAGNRWPPEETRVSNALSSDSLQPGQPVKVAIEVPYRP